MFLAGGVGGASALSSIYSNRGERVHPNTVLKWYDMDTCVCVYIPVVFCGRAVFTAGMLNHESVMSGSQAVECVCCGRDYVFLCGSGQPAHFDSV